MDISEIPQVEIDDALTVYVCARPLGEGGQSYGYEVRQQAEGPPVALAYSSLSLLTEKAGPDQPWAAMRLGELRDDLLRHAISTVLLDAPLEETWRWHQDEPPPVAPTVPAAESPAERGL